MITRVLQSLRDTAWHPTDEQLVAFIDAELGPREAAQVRRHIARCWACRGRERKLAETIGAFMEAYASHPADEDDEALLPHPARLPHAARAVLRERAPERFARLRRRVSEATRAVVSRAARHPYVPPAAIARVAAACATAAIIVLLSTGVPLSARQVARHVDRAERGALAATPAPVIYQRLDIAVRQLPGGATTRGTFDLWTDVERHRHHGAVSDGSARTRTGVRVSASRISGPGGGVVTASAASAPAVAGVAHSSRATPDADGGERQRGDARVRAGDAALTDLLALFARHGMSSAWPVSLRAYEQMRASVGEAIEERVVHEQAADGERRLTLETLGVDAGDQTIDTRLVVRERDWHPIEQRLTVREGSETTEFVVRETGFEVIPLATLPVAFFETSRPSELAAEAVNANPDADADAPAEARRPVRPTVSELVSAEVQAMFALHRAGMTAEDDIAVQRSESAIDVRGLTTTEARRRQLTDAIASIKHVNARIQTADEALSELSGAAAAARSNGGAATPSTWPATEAEDAAAKAAGSPAHAFRMDEAAIEATRVPVQSLAGAGTDRRPVDRGGDEASMRRAREAVRQSLTLLERAWALRRLAEWSRRTSASAVTASTSELIDLMVREHADAASRALAALDNTVTPALPAMSAVSAASAAAADRLDGPDRRDRSEDQRLDSQRSDSQGSGRRPAIDPNRAWVDVATDFFGVAAEIDRDTRRLFTASPTPTTDAQAADEARRLRHGLDRAARSLLELRQPATQPQP